ncbi:hypothetical protein KC323_g9571, partial [Hortaea werneckii]
MANNDDPVTAFKRGLSNLLENGKFADLTIICGTHTYKVHKNILCAHSDYFAALPKFAEGKTNTIHFKAIGDDEDDEACDDPEAIKLMIHYFYYLDYTATIASKTSLLSTTGTEIASKTVPPPKKKKKVDKVPAKRTATGTSASSSRDDDMVMHAKVFAAAVKYQVAGLSKLAAKKFKDAVKVNWHDGTFAEAVHIVYTTTPAHVRALRDVVTKILHCYGDTLLELDDVMQVVKNNKDIMFDLLCKGRELGAFK